MGFREKCERKNARIAVQKSAMANMENSEKISYEMIFTHLLSPAEKGKFREFAQ